MLMAKRSVCHTKFRMVSHIAPSTDIDFFDLDVLAKLSPLRVRRPNWKILFHFLCIICASFLYSMPQCITTKTGFNEVLLTTVCLSQAQEGCGILQDPLWIARKHAHFFVFLGHHLIYRLDVAGKTFSMSHWFHNGIAQPEDQIWRFWSAVSAPFELAFWCLCHCIQLPNPVLRSWLYLSQYRVHIFWDPTRTC